MANDFPISQGLRRAIFCVAVANLAYFGVEFAAARSIGSVSLFADSIDFLEDASVNALILFALSWSARARARLGMVLAGILLMPGLATLWTAWGKFQTPTVAPDAVALSLTGLGALGANLACAFALARFRRGGGSLVTAAFLSARNDAVANICIMAAGGLTLSMRSAWPDLVVGLGIAAINADAARAVWSAARRESEPAP